MIQVKVEDGGAVELTGPAEIEIVGMRGRRFVLNIRHAHQIRVTDANGTLTHESSAKVVDLESDLGV